MGKSTISKELACIYAKTKLGGVPLRVLLIDANLSYGSQRHLFGIASTKTDLAGFIRDYRENASRYGYDGLERVYTWEYIQKYLCYIKERNVYLLPAPAETSDMQVYRQEADMLFRILSPFFDVLIVDTANDASEFTTSAVALSGFSLFVVNDDERSIRKMIDMRLVFNRLGYTDRLKRDCGIVYNMYRPVKDRINTIRDMEERIQLPVVSVIRYFPPAWTYNNRLITIADHDNAASSGLIRLAGFIIPESLPDNERKPFFSRLTDNLFKKLRGV